MNNLEKMIEEITSVVSKYKNKPIDSGGMLRYTENADEIVVLIPAHLTELNRFKNVVIIYERN